MLWIVIAGCLLASAFNALSSLLEREAAAKPDVEKLFSKQLAVEITKSEKFIFGVILQLVATGLEIVAISQGTLVIVGPLLTLDIVFLWLFIGLRYQLVIRAVNWAAISCIIIGLGLLSIFAHASSDSFRYQPYAWIISIGSTLAVVGAAILTTKVAKSSRLKVAILSFATACVYAMGAGLLKLLLERLKTGGMHEVIFGWPLYVTIALAVLSLWMMQNTLSSGPLTISQPIIEIFQAGATAALGIFVFDDDVQLSCWSLTIDGFSMILLLIGIYILATNKTLFTARPKPRRLKRLTKPGEPATFSNKS